MPTLSDVAKVAGVGVMSVSRVVNGTRRVTPEVERKVRAAIERIGYEPNEAARVLKGHRAKVLGLIVPDLADPFFATCANAIQETAREAGYMTLMAASANREDIERQQAEIMAQRHVAGLLVIPSGTTNSHFTAAQKKGMPIVSFDRPLEHVDADAVLVDNRAAAVRVTEHLIAHGHQQILCVSDEKDIFTKNERVAGYSHAMRQASLPVKICLIGPIRGSLSEQLTVALSSVFIPTAIFATNNIIAVQCLRDLQKLGVQIPEKMALIGFDDFDAATLVRPTITVVRQPVVELGRRAALQLLNRIGNASLPSSSQIVLHTELILRQSCGCSESQNKP